MIKYYWKARDQRSKSVLLVLPPDTTQNNPTSIISRVVIFFGFLFCATEFQGAHLPCSHVNLSAFFQTSAHSTYLQDNEKIELCGVACTFVEISENGFRVSKRVSTTLTEDIFDWLTGWPITDQGTPSAEATESFRTANKECIYKSGTTGMGFP